MNKSKYFEREIALIKNEDYRKFIEHYLETYVPNYFWEIGASSSGKYHPQFSQGQGGLVRHTKAVIMFAEELLRMSSYMYMSEEHKDYVIMACIVHDTCKYGSEEFDKELYKDHAVNASVMVDNAWFDYFGINASEFFLSAIKCHMGQWSERENRPFTNIDRCVHMADYMASRSFIDIPQIMEEYFNCRCEEESEGKQPLASIGGCSTEGEEYEAMRFEETERKGSEDPINLNSIGGQMVRKMIEFYEKNN